MDTFRRCIAFPVSCLRAGSLLVVAMLVPLASCRDSPTAVKVKEPPLRLYSTVPALDADRTGDELSIVATFFTAPDLSELQFRLFPPPLSIDPPTCTGRTVTWPRARLRDGVVGEVFLIDSPTMPAPRLVRFFPGASSDDVGRCAGKVLAGPDRQPVNTLVVAYPLYPTDSPLENILDEVLARPPTSATLAELDEQSRSIRYMLRFLEIGARYFIVGILDTSGDGRYDRAEDLWGVYSSPNGFAEEVVAEGWILDTEFPEPGWRTDVHIVLQ